MIIYVMVLVQEANKSSRSKFDEKRAFQAKIGFFTDGIIVGLASIVVMDNLRRILSK